MRILILNGPNLNWLGKREPEIYGNQGFDEILRNLQNVFPQIKLQYSQNNVEGELINILQDAEADTEIGGIVFNAGAYSHTSLALADTLKAMSKPVVLVHISNVFAREIERHTDLLVANANGLICGLGTNGYNLAIQHILLTLNQ